MSFLPLYSLASLYPGPSPRLFNLSLPDTIGWVLGGLTSFTLNRFHKFEELPYETIESATKATQSVKKWGEFLQVLRRGRHKYTKEGDWGARAIKFLTASAPVVGVEQALRLSALKVQSFVTSKPSSIRDTDAFKDIEKELKTCKVFTEALEAKKKTIKDQRKGGVNVDIKVNAFFQEVEELLIKKLPTSARAPTWSDAVGFGVRWGTQIGLTWLGRYAFWQYCAEYIPESPGNLAYGACFIVAGYLYSLGLASTSKDQLDEFGLKANKTDCRKYLTKEIREEIREIAYVNLLFDNDLKTNHSTKLDELKEKLEKLSSAESTELEMADLEYDENLGWITPKQKRKQTGDQQTPPPVVPPAPSPAEQAGAPVPQPQSSQQGQTAVHQLAQIFAQLLNQQGQPQGVPPQSQAAPPAQAQGVPQQSQAAPPAQAQGVPQQSQAAPPAQAQGVPPQSQAAPPAQAQGVPPQSQAAPPAQAPVVPPPPRVVVVKRKEAQAEAVPPVRRRVVSVAPPPSMEEVHKELIPFTLYDVFELDPSMAIDRYKTRIGKLRLDGDLFISEIQRHQKIVKEKYIPRATRENPILLGPFGTLITDMDDMIAELEYELAKPEPESPSANNNAPKSGNKSGFRQPSFAAETPPPSKGEGAAPDPSFAFSPPQTTGTYARRGFADTTAEESEVK